MKLKSFSLLLLAATIALPSCKKDDDDKPATRAQMMVGTWHTDEVGLDSNANGTWDAAERRPAAGSDEELTITFNSDGTGSTTYALLPTPLPTSWSLQNGDNDLRLITNFLGMPDTTTVNIVSFSNTETVIRDQSESPVLYIKLKKQ